MENKIEEKAAFVDYLTQAMDGFAVAANKCAEKMQMLQRQIAVHSPVCLA